jgi:group I intron endonuclease
MYVGGTTSITRRWCEHRHCLRNGKHPNAPLQSEWDAKGEGGFEFIVLEIVPDTEDLVAAEQRWMDTMRGRGALFNLAPRAGTNAGSVRSEAVRARLVGLGKGIAKSAEHRVRISEGLTGRVMPPEVRAKISAAKRGEKSHTAKLRVADVLTIRALWAAQHPVRQIAARFCVGKTTVRKIITGQSWTNVPDVEGEVQMEAAR